jgi:hypothetical protein
MRGSINESWKAWMVVMSDRVVEASSESASKAKGSTGAGVLLGINLSIDLVPRV